MPMAPSQGVAGHVEAAASDDVDGHALYTANCVSCHDATSEGLAGNPKLAGLSKPDSRYRCGGRYPAASIRVMRLARVPPFIKGGVRGISETATQENAAQSLMNPLTSSYGACPRSGLRCPEPA